MKKGNVNRNSTDELTNIFLKYINKFKKYAKTSKKLMIVSLIILVSIVYSFFKADAKIKNMKHRLRGLETEAKKLNREVSILNRKLDRVNSNEFIEEIARKDLGLVKPGETLYIIIEEDNSQDK
ncbi:FtsB family cell division protein [Selenihalanaerobacter shriftii]|uniref:Cell division protein FtsB n=1 Tax=Selenihalanaerobacter shriftii TaxID=142842 RepID=A0A1T4N491_9FIRM|nr:septum formation initiator family protein [Selenihalanaerobacter shriftii]SJZ73887.1 cell division protein FtsB [Selenihalanaerobacter shriftii]